MGKTEKGTPKDLANRMKAKGLQKLRWYCQMCEKQCRDENGFKCHTTSESHQRQLLLFADNPDKYIDSFSQEFLEGYTNLLKRRFGTKRVNANNVYQEYIHDRDHVHMNSTQWETLTDFVKWIGREGHAVVDETEKGWYVQYIDRGPEAIRMQEMEAKRRKSEKRRIDEEEQHSEFIKRQADLNKDKNLEPVKFTELKRNGEEPISLKMTMSGFKKPKLQVEDRNPLKASSSTAPPKIQYTIAKKESVLKEIIEMERREKLQKELRENPQKKLVPNDEPWLAKDIFVKIVTTDRRDPSSKYYKEKGIIKEIIDVFAAIVKLNETSIHLKMDQLNLQTVVPARGKLVLILLGPYKGKLAILKSINAKCFSAELEIDSNGCSKILKDIPYEHFSKYNE